VKYLRTKKRSRPDEQSAKTTNILHPNKFPHQPKELALLRVLCRPDAADYVGMLF
jgi:hypothetical protein